MNINFGKTQDMVDRDLISYWECFSEKAWIQVGFMEM